jgi:hypothetical protein
MTSNLRTPSATQTVECRLTGLANSRARNWLSKKNEVKRIGCENHDEAGPGDQQPP